MSNICTLHCLSETIKFAALACELSTGEVRCVTTLESGGVAFGSMETWLLTSEKDRVGAVAFEQFPLLLLFPLAQGRQRSFCVAFPYLYIYIYIPRLCPITCNSR